jgi:alpha,alpha-trehalose phosphorylase
LPIYVQTARLWTALGYTGRDGCFHIDGVTGPDEYSAVVDDNVYTNLMARENLLAAADAADRHPETAEALDVAADEIHAWRRAAETMAVPYDEDERLLKQDKDFTDHEVWDFAATAAAGAYPLLLHFPYFDIYRKQVVKQADLVLALHWAGDQFTLEQKARAFAYYESLTVRDSSLSAATQAVVAAEVGQIDLASDYLAEAALIDLHDLQHNTRNGLHIASLAGTWLALVAGFGGMRDFDDRLCFHPQLPPGWDGMRFRVRWRGRLVQVGVSPHEVTYELIDEEHSPVRVWDVDTALELEPGVPVTRPLHPVKPLTARPKQPDGRAPLPAAELTARATS